MRTRWMVGAVLVAAAIAGPASGATNPPAPTGTTKFSLRLYQQLAAKDDRPNLVVSPYSVAEALAMLSAGAKGTTKTQLDAALGGPALAGAGQRKVLRTTLSTEIQPGAGTTVEVANALWPLTGYPIAAPYQATLTSAFGATASPLSFGTDGAGSARTINGWVSKATEGHIDKLVDASMFDRQTRLVLTNALLFRGKWSTPFVPSLTKPAAFTTAMAKKVSVQMMHGSATTTTDANPRVVTLQFTGTYWMRIALPAAHGRAALDAAEASLHVAIGPIDEAKICGDVDVAIPKWKAEATFARLTGALKAMGATQVFTKSADLTAISPAAAKVGLYVSNVVHRATIDVDEQGTIAAAATAEIGRASSEPLVQPTCPKLVELNRPFAYVIQHQNGEILFAGRVDDPSLK